MLNEEQLRILREQAKVIADKYISRSIEIKKRPSRTTVDSKALRIKYQLPPFGRDD